MRRTIYAISQFRGFKLIRTSFRILQREGLFALSRRLWGWLRGERTYVFRPGTDLYRRYVIQHTPHGGELTRQTQESRQWVDKPTFSIVTTLDRPNLPALQATIAAVFEQSYPDWEWCMAVPPLSPDVQAYLDRIARRDPRLRLIPVAATEGRVHAANAALRQARHAYGLFLPIGDRLAPDTLYTVAALLRHHPETDFVYTDHDHIGADGKRTAPFFKPDYSPALLLSTDYLGRLGVFRRALIEQVGALDPAYAGAEYRDFHLRISQYTPRIRHIPKVLYHANGQPTDPAAQIAALEAHLTRIGRHAPHVEIAPEGHPLATWAIPTPPPVDVIIPSKDLPEIVGRCLDTLFGITDYPHFRVILVDTGSVDPATHALYDRVKAAYGERFQVVPYVGKFNFSRACNVGAAHAGDGLLLFLNNDVEILHPDWLTRMVQWFESPDVGIVGAKLLYPDGKLQHAGVVVGLTGLAAHQLQGADEHTQTIYGSDDWYRDLLAVTGACLLISRRVFEAAGRFDETYLLNWSDIALCLKAREAGYRTVYTPHARLTHRESVSHQRRIPRVDFVRAGADFKAYIDAGDPYYNPNIAIGTAIPHVQIGGGYTAKAAHEAVMARLPNKEIIVLPDDM